MAYPVIRERHKVTRGFSSLHKAIDIAPIRKGTPEYVYAVGAGVITHVNIGGWRAGNNFAITLDGDGSIWWYTHLSTIGSIRKGQRFADGAALNGAMTGNTGFSFGVHLHLCRFGKGIIDNNTDPWPYIKNEPNPGAKAPVSKPSSPAIKPLRMRLINWVVYKDGALKHYFGYKDGRPIKWTGTYDVINRSKAGHYEIRGGDGRTAWVHKSASAGILK